MHENDSSFLSKFIENGYDLPFKLKSNVIWLILENELGLSG